MDGEGAAEAGVADGGADCDTAVTLSVRIHSIAAWAHCGRDWGCRGNLRCCGAGRAGDET